MPKASIVVLLLSVMVLGVVVVLTDYNVPVVVFKVDAGVFVWSFVGGLLSALTAVYLLWRWAVTGRANPLAFVWGVSFLGLFSMMLGWLFSSLGCVDAGSVRTLFALKIGLLFWCCGFLAGAVYVFYPDRGRLWMLLPVVVFVCSLFAAGYMCCVLRDAALLEKATALMLVTPILAVTAHSFGVYLRLRRAVFAALLYAGFATAIAAQIFVAFFYNQPLKLVGLALFDFSLALFLCGFIFMRFETQKGGVDDISAEGQVAD
ncbi:MAG: hypothetical protein DRP63_00890 [Planctomycetota bacterium]|nr:MAG: hypothetical protein DRP63_00890 [Planctomycetota bacterium]